MKKQFIMIMTDTQRLDMVSCYGDTGLKTPCIDSLAEDGIKFNKAYTSQPVCGPARSALFTGQFPSVCGGFSNANAPALNVKSIGQRLSDKGIFTGYIGKWHLDGGDYFGLGRAPEGWDADTWYDMRNYLEELTDEERLRSRHTTAAGEADVEPEFTYAWRCADRAVEFLKAHADEDFFLVVSFDEPHGPYLCPQPYASMYKDYALPKRPNIYDTLENKPVHQQVWAGERRFADREALELRNPAFFGCNSFVDSQIGRVIQAANQFTDSAAILYTTDHGDMLESHCISNKGPAAYEEICHVPLLLRGFGHGVVDTPVSHLDIPATIYDYFGFEKPMMFHGDSWLPMMGQWPEQRDVFVEFGRYETDHDGFGGFQPMRCIYDGRYKLAINLLSGDELYDLEQDPYEMENRIWDESLAEVRASLHHRLLDHMNEIRDPFRGYYWENRPWNPDPVTPTWTYTGQTRQREELDYEPVQLDYDTGLPITELVRGKDAKSKV